MPKRKKNVIPERLREAFYDFVAEVAEEMRYGKVRRNELIIEYHNSGLRNVEIARLMGLRKELVSYIICMDRKKHKKECI